MTSSVVNSCLLKPCLGPRLQGSSHMAAGTWEQVEEQGPSQLSSPEARTLRAGSPGERCGVRSVWPHFWSPLGSAAMPAFSRDHSHSSVQSTNIFCAPTISQEKRAVSILEFRGGGTEHHPNLWNSVRGLEFLRRLLFKPL